jgi:hypothetical protein
MESDNTALSKRLAVLARIALFMPITGPLADPLPLQESFTADSQSNNPRACFYNLM